MPRPPESVDWVWAPMDSAMAKWTWLRTRATPAEAVYTYTGVYPGFRGFPLTVHREREPGIDIFKITWPRQFLVNPEMNHTLGQLAKDAGYVSDEWGEDGVKKMLHADAQSEMSLTPLNNGGVHMIIRRFS